MSVVVDPEGEKRRIAALDELGILDTPPEEAFDRLVRLAARALDVPLALITFVDADRLWFKARVGIDAEQAPRSGSFCDAAIAVDAPGPFVVDDTALDERFAERPVVLDGAPLRFYAGQPLRSPDGHRVGTLCVLDRRPRHLDGAASQVLVDLAAIAEDELAARTLTDAADLADERQRSLIFETVHDGLILHDAQGRMLEWNEAAKHILGLVDADFEGRVAGETTWPSIRLDGSPYSPDDLPVQVTLRTGDAVRNAVIGVDRPDDTRAWLRVNAVPIDGDDGRGVVSSFSDVTSEVEATSTLRRSEALHRSTLEALDQGVVLVDEDGNVLVANPAAERMLGAAPTELAARWLEGDWLTLDEHGNVIPPEEAPILRAMQAGEEVRDEIVRWPRPDGTHLTFRVAITPFREVEGLRVLIISITDVTAERNAHRLLDTTWSAAPVGLVVVDDRGHIIRANEAYADQVGRAVDDVVGHDAREFLEPDLQQYATEAYVDAERPAGPSSSIDLPVSRPDGADRWVQVTGRPIPEGDERLNVVASVDVTERRRLEHDLRRFHILFQQANDIITVVTAEGRPRYASPSAWRVLGYPEEHHFDGGILGLVTPEDRELAHTEFEAIVASDRPRDPFLVRVTDGRGSIRHLEVLAANLLADPSVEGIVITARDVSERQRLTELLAHQATHDALTGLANRRLFFDHLDRALARRERDGRPIAVAYLDLDGFKAVNDRLGHAVGDELLRSVASRLGSSVRSADVVARFGGDEFVVLFDAVEDAEQAVAAGQRLIDAVADDTHPLPSGARCAASAGVAVHRPGESGSTLVSRADGALYRAKADGRSRVVLAADHDPA